MKFKIFLTHKDSKSVIHAEFEAPVLILKDKDKFKKAYDEFEATLFRNRTYSEYTVDQTSVLDFIKNEFCT